MNSKLKKEYLTNKIHSSEGNIKDTWSTINMLINKWPETTMTSSWGNEVANSEKIADSMNKYFCSIVEELSKDIPEKVNSFLSNQFHATDGSFLFTPINTEHIIKAISKFKSSNGFRLDYIPSFFQKKGMPILANSLSQIFHLCLSLGKFHEIWKKGRIAPIYKDGSRNKIFQITDRFLFCLFPWLFESILIQKTLST